LKALKKYFFLLLSCVFKRNIGLRVQVKILPVFRDLKKKIGFESFKTGDLKLNFFKDVRLIMSLVFKSYYFLK